MKHRLPSVTIVIICFIVFGLVQAGPAWFDKTTAREQKIEAIKSALPEEIDAFNKNGYTGLMVATSQGDKELAELFLERGASVFIKSENKFRKTPLHIAVSHAEIDGAYSLIPVFIAHGAFVEATDVIEERPLHYVTLIEDREVRMKVMHMLVDYMADLNAQDFEGNTLLHYIVAAERHNLFMRYVLDAFPNRLNLTIKNKKGRTPEEYAMDLGSDNEPSTVLAALRAPLKRIGSGYFGYTEKDDQDRTALMFAAYRGDLKLTEKYIEKGADVNDRSKRNETALLYAMQNKNPIPFLKLLFKNGAKPNVAEQVTGYTPLHLVSLRKNLGMQKEAIQLLLAHDADLSARDKFDNTLIGLLALRNNIHLLEYIFKILPQIGKSNGLSSVQLVKQYKNDILKAPQGKKLYEALVENLSGAGAGDAGAGGDSEGGEAGAGTAA